MKKPYNIIKLVAAYSETNDAFLGWNFHKEVAQFDTAEEAWDALAKIRKQNDRESEEQNFRVDEDIDWEVCHTDTYERVGVHPLPPGTDPKNWPF